MVTGTFDSCLHSRVVPGGRVGDIRLDFGTGGRTWGYVSGLPFKSASELRVRHCSDCIVSADSIYE